MPDYTYIPTESEEQQQIFQWAAYAIGRWPELKYLHHIPNGGARSKATSGKLKAEGVKPGVPDICLPVPHGKYHGLYIELKRRKGGRLSDDQSEWLTALRGFGYFAVSCRGAQEAIEVIQRYVSLKEE